MDIFDHNNTSSPGHGYIRLGSSGSAGRTVIMKMFLIMISLFSLGSSLALDPNSSENRKWWAGNENYTIRLQGEMTLTDILDADIRPRHIPGMGSHLLQFQAKSVSFVFSGGKEINTKDGYGQIYVGSDHRILNITFYEDYDTGIDEAHERLLKIRTVLDGGGVSISELNQKIDEVRNAEEHWVPDDFGVGKKRLDEFWGVFIMAGQSFKSVKPFRFKFTAMRNYKNRERDRPERNPMGVLLEPPEGYEHISFDYVTTPTDPNATPLPYLSPLKQAQLVSENFEKRQISLTEEDITPQLKPTIEPSTDDIVDKSTKSIYVIVIVLLGLCLFSYFAIRRVKRH